VAPQDAAEHLLGPGLLCRTLDQPRGQPQRLADLTAHLHPQEVAAPRRFLEALHEGLGIQAVQEPAHEQRQLERRAALRNGHARTSHALPISTLARTGWDCKPAASARSRRSW
jgi:hypothetical protein